MCGSCGNGSSNACHSPLIFEHAIAHYVEELCSSFDHSLSGEPDEDDASDRDDLMVGGVDSGNGPGADSIVPQPAAAGSETVGANAWVSVLFGI